jgi:hypothetical protein
MNIFGHEFKNLEDHHVQDLLSLEREGAIYTDHWIEGLNDFRHVRIRFTEEETLEFVRSLKAWDLRLVSEATWAREIDGIPPDIAARADSYRMRTIDGEVFEPPYHCPAAFYGPHLQTLLCSNVRDEVLEEQGIAAFLATVRRAVDALTPAIRCFTRRERGLSRWPISREDDVRDLLYVMLRASISDVQREEPIPRRAGGSQLADLHSGLAKTLIEIKWVRASRWRRVLDEIHADIQTYARHPDCHYLIFVIIDSGRQIPDPHLVERELNSTQSIDGKPFSVIAYVRNT